MIICPTKFAIYGDPEAKCNLIANANTDELELELELESERK